MVAAGVGNVGRWQSQCVGARPRVCPPDVVAKVRADSHVGNRIFDTHGDPMAASQLGQCRADWPDPLWINDCHPDLLLAEAPGGVHAWSTHGTHCDQEHVGSPMRWWCMQDVEATDGVFGRDRFARRLGETHGGGSRGRDRGTQLLS